MAVTVTYLCCLGARAPGTQGHLGSARESEEPRMWSQPKESASQPHRFRPCGPRHHGQGKEGSPSAPTATPGTVQRTACGTWHKQPPKR